MGIIKVTCSRSQPQDPGGNCTHNLGVGAEDSNHCANQAAPHAVRSQPIPACILQFVPNSTAIN